MLLTYILAVVIGLSLGLIGAGGSILTMPVLVYLSFIQPLTASAYSLFIVGSTSLYGGLSSALAGRVNLKTAVVFALPSLAATYITRRLLVPLWPQHWLYVGAVEVNKNNGVMLLLAALMLAAGLRMLQKKTPAGQVGETNYAPLLVTGTVVGLLAGAVGAGGGFLIIPALVLYAGLDMKAAVSTSLIIMAANSLAGFVGDIQNKLLIDWYFLFSFTLLAMAGMTAGQQLAKKINSAHLKAAFGLLVLVLAITIVAIETIKALSIIPLEK